jgi:hypothetical protein
MCVRCIDTNKQRHTQHTTHAQAELEVASNKATKHQDSAELSKALIEDFEARFRQSIDDKNVATAEVQALQRRLMLAQRFIASLGKENEWWKSAIVRLRGEERRLRGDAFLACVTVSMCGTLNDDQRAMVIMENMVAFMHANGVPVTDEVDILRTLITPNAQTCTRTLAQWQADGLACVHDRITAENAAIVTNTTRAPLLLDPESRSLPWLRAAFGRTTRLIDATDIGGNIHDAGRRGRFDHRKSGRRLSVGTGGLSPRPGSVGGGSLAGASPRGVDSRGKSSPRAAGNVAPAEEDHEGSSDVTQTPNTGVTVNTILVETAIQALANGYTLVVYNVGPRIDTVLFPLISRLRERRGRGWVVKFGGRDVEVSEKFQLILHTAHKNPRYSADTLAECNIVNFGMNSNAVEDYLMAEIVAQETPNAQKQRAALEASRTGHVTKLEDTHETILAQLNGAGDGTVYENLDLIAMLESSKGGSSEVMDALTACTEEVKALAQRRERFRRLAGRGYAMYSVMGTLSSIHPIYGYDLRTFTRAYLAAISAATARYGAMNPIHVPALIKASRSRNPYMRARIACMMIKAGLKGVLSEGQVVGSTLHDSSLKSPHSPKHVLSNDASKKNTHGAGLKSPKTDVKKPASDIVKRHSDIDAVKGAPRALGANGSAGVRKQGAQEEDENAMNMLMRDATYLVFDQCRRGMMDRDRLMLAGALALRILIKEGKL